VLPDLKDGKCRTATCQMPIELLGDVDIAARQVHRD
jgi:hypothetical protein